MRKVAILKIHREYYRDGYDDYTKTKEIIESIIDWQEISDEDFQILKKATQYDSSYVIIERVKDEVEFIKETVKDYLERAKKRELKQQKAREARENREKTLKEKRERKKFEELKKKFEDVSK